MTTNRRSHTHPPSPPSPPTASTAASAGQPTVRALAASTAASAGKPTVRALAASTAASAGKPAARALAASTAAKERALSISIARFSGCVAVGDARIRAVLRAVARAQRWQGDVSLAVVDDDAIAALNGRFLRTHTPTDVLAFAYGDDADGVAGEIVVSDETAARTARALGEPPERELLRYCVHGLLHLCGFDDATPRARRAMHAREDRFLPPPEEFDA